MINCKWGDFGNWTQCTKTCGSGTQTKSRAKIQKAENGGAECEGSSSEVTTCEMTTCPGNWKMRYDSKALYQDY